jgi:cobalamin biosynthesis protein CobT
MAYWDRKSNQEEKLAEVAKALSEAVSAIHGQQRLLFLKRLGPLIEALKRLREAENEM